MRDVAIHALVFPLALAAACGTTVIEAPLEGDAGPPTGSTGRTDASDHRIDCTEGIADFCAATDANCVTTWPDAASQATWPTASPDGCVRVATGPCAGFLIAEPWRSPTPPFLRYFYDATTGELVAVVAVPDATSSQCFAGPSGFTDSLILDCNPPLSLVCAPDAAAPSVDGAVTDAADDGALVDGAD